MNLFGKNLELLQQRDALLARRVQAARADAEICVTHAKNNHPIPRWKDVLLHSSYDPVSEASKLLDHHDLSGGQGVIVLGLGFAYHVKELLRRTEGRVVVIEKSLAMLRAAMEHVDLEDVISRVTLLIEETPAEVAAQETVAAVLNSTYTVLAQAAALRCDPDYYNAVARELERRTASAMPAGLKVLVVSPIYGGSLPIARYAARALERVGCSVEFVDNSLFRESLSAIGKTVRELSHQQALNRALMQFLSEYAYVKAQEFKPDLVFAMAQAPLTNECLRKLGRDKIRTAFWFVENYKCFTYWREVATEYDYFFTIQRGEFFRQLNALGVFNCYYLPPACDPDAHRPASLSAEERARYGSDLSFAGYGYYNRKCLFEGLLDFDFKIWGSGWDRGNGLSQVVQEQGREFDAREMVKIFSAAKINLNLHSSTYSTGVEPGGDFVNPRTFELAGCGAFQLVDERAELGNHFALNEEVITFSDLSSLREKIRYYLDHPAERADIAQKGQARTYREHTYDLRMQEMLSYIFSENVVAGLERHRERNRVASLLKEAGPDHELHAVLARYAPSEMLTVERLLADFTRSDQYHSDAELIFRLMNNLLAEGKKR
jgi:spore maturation protein CgeB